MKIRRELFIVTIFKTAEYKINEMIVNLFNETSFLTVIIKKTLVDRVRFSFAMKILQIPHQFYRQVVKITLKI